MVLNLSNKKWHIEKVVKKSIISKDNNFEVNGLKEKNESKP